MAPSPAPDTLCAPSGLLPLARSGLELHHELHARPPLPVRVPCVVSYWIQVGMQPARAEAALAQLCRHVGAASPAAEARHVQVQGTDFDLKYERHGEFVSWQVHRPVAPEELSGALAAPGVAPLTALQGLPANFLAALGGDGSGELLAGTHVVVVDARDDPDAVPQWARRVRDARADGAEPPSLMGSYLGDSRGAALLTPLQVEADGFTRFVLLDIHQPPDQLAREAQRLCEIEAYRMLAMLGFPLAQTESQAVSLLERQLQAAVDALGIDAAPEDADVFDALMRLAAAAETAGTRTRYRFSATRAYHALVQQRLTDLREQRMHGVQTLQGFLDRRLAPAMAFVESTDRRLGDLGARIHRALDLARVRMEAQQARHHQALLRLQADRQHEQLQLQRTVEGLSVLAISYYALGLVGYLAKALHKVPQVPAWVPGADTLVALAVIPVIAAVGWGVRRLRHR